ncbi:MAG: polyketide synthase dehydratase domain-containing protein [Syntrophales bacterium]|jgi:phosphopantetheinyl transferase|nr:polyketide synthase dehydratase domain-containing protein [Syntrophales bacterium]
MKTSAVETALPESRERVRLPLTIPITPYLRNHRIDGKIVLPAVEILQHLAASAKVHRPDAAICRMGAAKFERFLLIPEDSSVIEACHELEIHENSRLVSRLTTRNVIPGIGIKRTRVHAQVEFTAPEVSRLPLPMDMAAALDGVSFEIPASQLYRELVPFGPAYQNIIGSLFLTGSGAVAQVFAARQPAVSDLLGSPFPFDAALHAACAWGQRFHHLTAFPVGFEERIIFEPTAPGEIYHCRVLPVAATGYDLTFDIWIYDAVGGLREEIRGVAMRDISGGRVRPPDWVRSEGSVTLAVIGEQCRAVAVVDRRTMADFAHLALTVPERERLERMGNKRQADFLAARLALKFLSRKLAGGDLATPASAIHTVSSDGIRPCCTVTGTNDPIFCSVSHDSRFAVAVAGDGEIGVDVERLSDKVVKARRIFMGGEELALTEASSLGIVQASIRVWSIKEGIAKATGRPLAEAWKKVKIECIGRSGSLLTVEGARYTAFHETVDDHVFTLVKREMPGGEET